MDLTKIYFGIIVVAALLLSDVIEVSGGDGKDDKATATPTPETKGKTKPKDGKKGSPPGPPEEKKKDPPSSPPEEKKDPPPSPPEQKNEPPPSPPEVKKDPPPNPPEEKKEPPPSPPEEKKDPPLSPPEEKKEPPPSPPAEKKEPPPSPPEEKKIDSPPSSTAENTKTTPPSPTPAPVSFAPKSDSFVSKGIKMVAGKGVVGKVLLVTEFQPVPTDLSGKTDEELKKYINILVEERELIELRFIYHMSLSLLVGIAAWSLQPYTAVLPVLTAAADHEETFSSSLPAQWQQHQERLAAFILEYMRVKKIDPSTLAKNTQGVSSIKVERSENTFVNLPVWRTQKNAPLPPESLKLNEGSKNLLRNWWNQK